MNKPIDPPIIPPSTPPSAKSTWRRLLAWLLALTLCLLTIAGAVVLAYSFTTPRVSSLDGLDDGMVVRGRPTLQALVGGPADRVVFQLAGPRAGDYVRQLPSYGFLQGLHTASLEWDTSDWPDGRYNLTVWACRAERCSSLERHFTLANVSPPRIVALSGVAEGGIVRGKVDIAADVSGAVDELVFQLAGPRATTHVEYGPPYSFLNGWDTSDWPDGQYTLIARACLAGRCDRTLRSFAIGNGLPFPAVAGSEGASNKEVPSLLPLPDDPIFQRPNLVNPRTIHLSDAKPVYVGNNEDVLVVVDGKMSVPAKISNVHSFIMVGAEFSIADPLPAERPFKKLAQNEPIAMKHKGLSLEKISGVGYLEGVYIDGSNGNMSEGLQIWGSSGGSVVIVNSRIEGVRTTGDDLKAAEFNHSDLIQLMSGSLYLRNVTAASSDFQGIYLNAEHGNTLGIIKAQRVNIRDVRRQAWYLNSADRSGLVWAEASDLWNQQSDVSTYPDSADYPFLPEPDSVSQAAVRWLKEPQIVAGATIRRGLPPGGDFAPPERVGLRYDPAFFE